MSKDHEAFLNRRREELLRELAEVDAELGLNAQSTAAAAGADHTAVLNTTTGQVTGTCPTCVGPCTLISVSRGPVTTATTPPEDWTA